MDMQQKHRLFFGLMIWMVCASVPVLAQQKLSGPDADKVCSGSTLIVTGKGAKVPTFIQMGETSNYPITDFPRLTRTLLHMGEHDELKESKKGKDYLGFVHHHYRQLYNDIPVEGAEYVMHEKNARIITLDGFFIDSIQVATDPVLTAEKALDLALKACGAKKYRWENADEEHKLKQSLKDSSATWYPKPELCIASRNLDLLKREMHLCYRVDIQTSDPAGNEVIFVDAITGEVIGRKTIGAGAKQK
jgi:Zn-dependent metalloprotease